MSIPLKVSVEYTYSKFDQHFYFKTGRDHQKISYERRVYESADIRSLLIAILRTQRDKVLSWNCQNTVLNKSLREKPGNEPPTAK